MTVTLQDFLPEYLLQRQIRDIWNLSSTIPATKKIEPSPFLVNLKLSKIQFSLSISTTILMAYGVMKCLPVRSVMLKHRHDLILARAERWCFCSVPRNMAENKRTLARTEMLRVTGRSPHCLQRYVNGVRMPLQVPGAQGPCLLCLGLPGTPRQHPPRAERAVSVWCAD